MRTVVCVTTGDTPTPGGLKVAQADLVVLFHGNGLWSVWKDPHGATVKRVPWDALASHVKANVPLFSKAQ